LKRKGLLVFLSLVLALSLVMAACAKSAPPAEEVVPPPAEEEVVPPPVEEVAPTPEGPIRIGVLDAYTGWTAVWAYDHKRGMEMAIEALGDEVAGRKVEVYYEDSEGDPSVALAKVKRLVMENEVHIIMGFMNDYNARAVRPFMEEERIPMFVTDAATSDSLNHTKDSVLVRATYNEGLWGVLSADYAYEQGYRRASLLSADMSSGYEGSAGFARRFTELGGEIIQESYFPMDITDWSPYLVNLDRTADVLYGFNFMPTFLPQYAEYGLQGVIPTMMITTTDEVSIAGQGEAAVGNICMMYYTHQYDNPISQKLVDELYERYGELPVLAPLGYAGVQIAYEAIKAIDGNVEDSEAFLEALKSVDIEDTPEGRIRFDDYGMAIRNFWMLEVVEQKVKKYEYTNRIIATYEDIDQFWPWTDEEYLSWPTLIDFRGTLVGRTDFTKL